MKNSKLRRALLLVASAVLLVCVSVGATLAYLTDDTDVVTNTFVVGDGISIGLDEAYVYPPSEEPDGTLLGKINGTGRGTGNEYKLVPGWTYDKDPTVHLYAVSGDCYLFVKVVNGIAPIEDADAENGTIAAQMEANGWVSMGNDVYFYGKNDPTNGDVVSNKEEGASTISFPVFSTFSIQNLDSIDATYADATVTIDAFAIQADGFANASAAWAVAEPDFNN